MKKKINGKMSGKIWGIKKKKRKMINHEKIGETKINEKNSWKIRGIKEKKKNFIMRKLGKQKLQKQSKYEKSKGRKKKGGKFAEKFVKKIGPKSNSQEIENVHGIWFHVKIPNFTTDSISAHFKIDSSAFKNTKGEFLLFVPHDDFGGLSFPGSRFAGYDNAWVSSRSFHCFVGGFSDGKDVRWSFINFSSFVQIDKVFVVRVHFLIGVDTHADFANVGVNEVILESDFQVGVEIVHVDLG